jgi:hypothetical protein
LDGRSVVRDAAVDDRITSRYGSRTLLATGIPAMALIKQSAAARLISPAGMLIVVSGGSTWAASFTSSNPVMERACGTFRPIVLASAMAPMASVSVVQITAVMSG